MVGLILYMKTFVSFGFFFSQVLFSSFVLPFLKSHLQYTLGVRQNLVLTLIIAFCWIRNSSRCLCCGCISFSSHFFFWNDNDSFSLSSHSTKYLVVDSSLCTNTYSLGGLWLTCCTAQKKQQFFLSFILVWFLLPIKSKAKVTDLKYYKYCCPLLHMIFLNRAYDFRGLFVCI